MSVRARPVALLVVWACSLGWLDPSATPRTAARLYAAGKFDDAAARYSEALIDAPDSSLLHFNLGDAEYRRGQFEAAATAFARLPRDTAAEYNRGNAIFRKGESLQKDKPQDALAQWAEALVVYRRAIATDAADEDAKFNYEWVSRKIAELKKKLEDQQKQQDQQQQDQQQQQDDQGEQQEQQQQQPQPQDQQQPQDQPPQDKHGEGDEQKPPEQAPEQQNAQAQQDRAPSDGRMSPDEATALLEGERNEELQPDEVIRRQLGTGDVPAQDW